MAKKYENRICAICNSEFEPIFWNQKYCCEECRKEGYKISDHKRNKTKKRKEYMKKYDDNRLNNPKRREERRLSRNNYYYNNVKNNPILKLENSLRISIKSYINKLNKQKINKTFNILGYTAQDLVQHLESQFKPDMTWENHGTLWHIDHIRPVASYYFYDKNLKLDENVIKECWSLDNLRPLYATENLKKGSLYKGKRHKIIIHNG